MVPILYSYRRCPYAIRARMALQYAGIQFECREIALKDKPQSMLAASPKGTVPVLCVDDLVLDESLDIIHWALSKSDPDGWAAIDTAIADEWIAKNDGPFKLVLDQYKYPNRFPELKQENVFHAGIDLLLLPIENALQSHNFLLGNKMSWVDVALFPFIRQFSMVNLNRFDALPLPLTQRWLKKHLDSELFRLVMQKRST